ncbi:hypothetical protein HXX76_007244 [Chlamydomonas incerta]|uniref:Hpc2-related domain-containing protein n=1 Tax=Chlamydomonas incerta TaxID=51695 RepID=A0A835W0W8_CHLIN|nr:hypothetical protein HXX76_007244 [Chlamydomonas incerta]|eukprot:KAG2435160.1 hypothetical protein HXX76_007244 [Chlamydomonas incerta]
MTDNPPKPKKRIVPVRVDPQEAGGSALGAAPPVPGAAQRASAPEVDYTKGPFTLKGRRVRVELTSDNYVINWNELLKKDGVDPKAHKAAKKAAAKAAKAAPAGADALPLLGLPRGGASPGGAGGKAMFGSVVDRLERTYRAACGDDDTDEGEEGESDDEEEVAASEADGSGGSSSDSESSDEEAGGGRSAAEQSGPEGDGGAARAGEAAGATGAGTSGTGAGAAGAGAAGAGAAGDAAGAKKPRKRRPAFEAYEADFIDDEEELEYERRRKAKAKFKGFYINKGQVELEVDPDELPERPGAKRQQRPRAPPAPGAKSKAAAAADGAAPAGGSKAGAGGVAAAGPSSAAAAAGAGAGAVAAAGALSTPQKPSKRKAEGDGQPVAKRRKQPAAQGEGKGAPKSPAPAAGAAGATVAGTGGDTAAGAPAAAPEAAAAPRATSIAALAAAKGRSAAASAAANAVAASGTGAGAAGQAAASTAPAGGQGTDAGGSAGPSGSQPQAGRGVPGRRPASAAASLDPFLSDARKKLTSMQPPPADLAAVLKAIDAAFTQVALFVHRHHPNDEASRDTGLAELLATMAESVPAAVPAEGAAREEALKELRMIAAKKVERCWSSVNTIAGSVKKMAADVAAAEAQAASQQSAGGGAGQSDDDEFVASAPPAVTAALEGLESKLRSYMNLYRRLVNTEDDDAMLSDLAPKAGTSVDVLRRAMAVAKPAGQRKRAGGGAGAGAAGPAAAKGTTDEAAARQDGGASGTQAAAAVAAPAAGATEPAPQAPLAAKPPMPSPAKGAAAAPAAAAKTLGTQGADGAGTAAELQHSFPPLLLDAQQKQVCKEVALQQPGTDATLLELAFNASRMTDMTYLILKVLCYQPEGAKPADIADLAVQRGYISWPAGRPRSDLRRLVASSLKTKVLSQHVLHIGADRHVLKALKPAAEAVPRPSRLPGSTGASPAAGMPPPPAAEAAAATTAASPPAFVLPPAADDSDTGGGDAEPGGTQAPAGADGAAGAAGGSELDEAGPLSKEEDDRQLDECFEAAERAGASRQQLVETAKQVERSKNARIVFKVLCQAGPRGLGPTDIARRALDLGYATWPRDKMSNNSNTVSSALRSYSKQFPYIGSHLYTLALFPGVVPQAKPSKAEGGGKGGGGGKGAGKGAGAGTGAAAGDAGAS